MRVVASPSIAFGRRVRELREQRGWTQEDARRQNAVGTGLMSAVLNAGRGIQLSALSVTLRAPLAFLVRELFPERGAK